MVPRYSCFGQIWQTQQDICIPFVTMLAQAGQQCTVIGSMLGSLMNASTNSSAQFCNTSGGFLKMWVLACIWDVLMHCLCC